MVSQKQATVTKPQTAKNAVGVPTQTRNYGAKETGKSRDSLGDFTLEVTDGHRRLGSGLNINS